MMRMMGFWIGLSLVAAVCATDSAATADTRIRISKQSIDAEADHAVVGGAATTDTKRNRVMVFGRHSSTTSRQTTRLALTRFDLSKNRWSVAEVKGAGPQGGGHPGLVYVASEDALYLFGGWPDGGRAPLAELWRLDLSKDEPYAWTSIPQHGDWPPARNGMVLVADDARGRLLLHGGDGGPHPQYGYTPLDDLWAFDLEKGGWAKLDATGSAPEPRWNHAGAIDSASGKLYVFGGGGYVLKPEPRLVADTDVFVLDLVSHAWTKLPAQDRSPRPVQGTCFALDTEANALVLVGGLALDRQGRPGIPRVYCYDLQRMKWTRSKQILDRKRRDHVGVYDPIGHRHVIFGGQSVIEEGNFYRPGTPYSDTVSITVKRVEID